MIKTTAILIPALLFAGLAFGETTDTTLAAPGCYIGSGCDQNGWDVSNNGTTELGLAAIIRFQGAPGQHGNDGSIVGNTYYVPFGPGTASNLALWNFEFSINTAVNGNTQHLSDYSYVLSITDLTAGTPTFNIDPTSFAGFHQGAPGAYTGAQDSENLGFGNPTFDPSALHNYEFKLSEYSGQSLTNSATIFVDVVTPEPSTVTMAGLSLLALVYFVRRKQTRLN